MKPHERKPSSAPTQIALIEDRWKYIFNVRNGSEELFDLAVDAAEQTNVARLHAEICARLRQRLAAWTEANRRQYLQSGRDQPDAAPTDSPAVAL